MVTKLGRMVTYLEGVFRIKSHDPLITLSYEIKWQTKTIELGRVALTTQLGRVVTYHEVLTPIKSHDPLSPWSCEITWQTKTIIYTLPQCLRPQNLPGWWFNLSSSYPKSHDHIITWSGKIAWETKNISPLTQCVCSQNLAG